MKLFFALYAACIASLNPISAFAQNNLMDCEVIVPKSKQAGANFLPARKFIFSVFSGNSLKEIDGAPIKALLCTRQNIMPTQFDIKFAQTGVSLYLSPDFDKVGAPLLSVYKEGEEYIYQYAGLPLSNDDKASIKLWMQNLNQTKDKNAEN